MRAKVTGALVALIAFSVVLGQVPATARGRGATNITARPVIPSSRTPFEAAGKIFAKATRSVKIEDPQKLAWPVKDTINSPFTGEHAGIDIEGVTGDPIIAAAAGKVVFAGDDGDGYGLKIVIRHDRKMSTLYSHLLDLKVKQGKVERGDVIGTVGCTGSCTGDHLHFEVLINDTPRNPMEYLKGGST